MALAQPAAEPDLQLRGPGRSCSAAAAATAAASAASRDADVPGRLGDPGDRRVPGSAAAAAAAAAGARAGLSERLRLEIPARRFASGPVFFWALESAQRACVTGEQQQSQPLPSANETQTICWRPAGRTD